MEDHNNEKRPRQQGRSNYAAPAGCSEQCGECSSSGPGAAPPQPAAPQL